MLPPYPHATWKAFLLFISQMFLAPGERNLIQISLMATVLEGCLVRVKDQVGQRDEGS